MAKITVRPDKLTMFEHEGNVYASFFEGGKEVCILPVGPAGAARFNGKRFTIEGLPMEFEIDKQSHS